MWALCCPLETPVIEKIGLQVDSIQVDLASLNDVKRLCGELANTSPLDVLICNAGIMCPLERLESPDGFEYQFAVRVVNIKPR